MEDNLMSGSARLDQEPATNVRTLDEDYGKHLKIFTDGSKMGDKVGYAIVKNEHTIKKRIYLKTWCSVRSSLQLLGQSNRK
jgi:hypothetical protein